MTDTAPTHTPAAGDYRDDILHPSKITAMQWLILTLCVLSSMIEGFDVVIIAFTAPAIAADWGVPSGAMGMVFSAGVFGMTIGAMFLSSLSDLYGRRTVVSIALMVAGLATGAVVFSRGVGELILLRVIAGLALGAFIAALSPLAGEYSPRRYRTLIISVLLASASLGSVVGGLIAAALIGDYGWKIMFFYAGAITVLLGVLIQWLVPESIAFIIKRRSESTQHDSAEGGALDKVNRILRYIGQQTITQLPAVSATESRESASIVSLLTPARRATTILIWSGFFCGFVAVYFITSWMPQILVNAGLSQSQAIQGGVVIAFGSIIGTLLIGFLSKWFALNKLIAAAFITGALCFVVLSFLVRDIVGMTPALWIMLFMTGISLMGGFSNMYTVPLIVYPTQVRSTGLGWAAGLGRAGAVASPALAGVMISFGVSMPALFWYFGGPVFVAAACIVLVRMKQAA